MNKQKLNKIIDDFKENINKDLEQHQAIKLYVKSWVIGGLEMIQNKANGGSNYYPFNATYKELLRDFMSCFFCSRISEELRDEATYYLITLKNMEFLILLTNQFYDIIKK